MISNLPQELIDQISLALDYDDLKNTLFVSRAFQAAAERASGAFTSFTFMHHSPVERQRFLDKFAGYRFRFLRHVKVCTVFPQINRFTPISCRETIAELRDKDEDFTRQIRDVWTSIRLVEAAHNDIVG
jgi:alkanesulfonate monooxygenase SsuD/methylene tetrahydromethanopterin reductase-like flavin-dependent oxidoreductase (luciferase family)